MNPIEALNKMKDVLMENGWCRAYLEDREGKVCLLGARNKVLFGRSMWQEDGGYEADYVSNLIESVLPEICHRVEGESDTRAWVFNDRYAESLNDVLDVLDKAIIAEKERNHGTH